MESNAGCMGTVVGLGCTRVEVQFDGRTKFKDFQQTDEPVAHKVAAEYLLVCVDGKKPENVTAFGRKK